jgi:two-component system KDP operon response regulator KdpE
MAESNNQESVHPVAESISADASIADRKRILIVDDEMQIARVLRTSLTSRGYEARVAADGEIAMDTIRDWSPDMIITDLSMPNINGIELCRRVRKNSRVPIIVLSVKAQETTKIEALDAGADGYITKPFSMQELLARVRALLRRAPAKIEPDKSILKQGDFVVDQELRSVSVRGEKIHLTPKEYDLLLYLLRNAGQVINRSTLLDAIWGEDAVQQNQYLHVFIGQLRKKIEPDPATPRYILTEPWVGYCFRPDGE